MAWLVALASMCRLTGSSWARRYVAAFASSSLLIGNPRGTRDLPSRAASAGFVARPTVIRISAVR